MSETAENEHLKQVKPSTQQTTIGTNTGTSQQKNKKKKKPSKSKFKPKPIVKPLTREFKNRGEAHALILKFHELQKKVEQLEALPQSAEIKEKIETIKNEMEDLGGIELYQKASMYGETFKSYNTSKWVTKCLKEKGFKPPQKSANSEEPASRVKTLDVGAINNHFKSIKWMDLTAIDINPMDSGVIKCDFFDFDAPSSSFDVIVLSLVINYVGDPRKRGLMLHRCTELLKCASKDSRGGLLFLIIPVACIENSRYLTHDILSEILSALGFATLEHKTSKKLAFYMLELVAKKPQKALENVSFKKQVIRPGGERNNFAIVFDPAFTLESLRQSQKRKQAETDTEQRKKGNVKRPREEDEEDGDAADRSDEDDDEIVDFDGSDEESDDMVKKPSQKKRFDNKKQPRPQQQHQRSPKQIQKKSKPNPSMPAPQAKRRKMK